MKRITTDEFIKRCDNKHGGRYDYGKTIYTNQSTKVCIICPEHGEFWQLPQHHDRRSQGCPLCNTKNMKLSKDVMIKRSVDKFGDVFDFSESVFVNTMTPMDITCIKCGGTFTRSYNAHIKSTGCSICVNKNRGKWKTYSTDKFIKRSKLKHGAKYDYSKTEYIGCYEKVEINCPKHGLFKQQPYAHLNGQGCSKCYEETRGDKLSMDTDEFITRSRKTHGLKYDYTKVDYRRSNIKVCIICDEHGMFWQKPNNHIQGQNCPKCYSNISKTEQYIDEYIKSLNIETITSSKKIISPLELDIYIPSKIFAIEYNGNYWHSEYIGGKNRNYHLNKTKMCQEKGIQLIHIFEDEWKFKQSIVKNRLRHILGKTKYRIQARKCEIREITPIISNKFLNKYHIQGSDRSSIRLGLFYRNRMVSVMTFSKRRFDNKVGFELVRYCTVGHSTVMGGAGKLLKYFERNWKPVSIVSYADKRWSVGGLYKSLGFDHTHDSTPNYHYMSNHLIRESRQKYQKHKLHNILDEFDIELSEWENMKNNGYDRIWDCGNMVFVKLYKYDYT